MITPKELNIFQKCRLQWKFSKKEDFISLPILNSYQLAIKKTVFQMYTYLQEKHKLLSLKQIKDRWDKNWYLEALKEKICTNPEILDHTVNGWLLLENYWNKYYIQESLIPVGINFEFSTFIYNIHYRIHIDLAFVDEEKKFHYRQFSLAKNEWEIYNHLSTKLEIVGLNDCLKVSPINLRYFDLESRKTELLERNLNISPDYFHNSKMIITDISSSIKNEVIYPCISEECRACKYNKQCWV